MESPGFRRFSDQSQPSSNHPMAAMAAVIGVVMVAGDDISVVDSA